MLEPLCDPESVFAVQSVQSPFSPMISPFLMHQFAQNSESIGPEIGSGAKFAPLV
jgi:hypothetical protein